MAEEILQYHARRFLYYTHKEACEKRIRQQGKEPSEAAFALILTQKIQTLVEIEDYRSKRSHELDITSTEAAAALFIIEKFMTTLFKENYTRQKQILVESFSDR